MFNEKEKEYSTKKGEDIPVWQTPKYKQSKAKALEAMEKYPFLKEGDFWILMNETKNGKMAYSGLIISHNACLKLNDNLQEKDRFKPECVSENQNGYRDSLVYTYCCPEQGMFEVGEVNNKNCKNDYPYAMAFKRLFDRVVLKQTKFAYDGIYSDSEAEEFKERYDENPEDAFSPTEPVNDLYISVIEQLVAETNTDLQKMLNHFEVSDIREMTVEQGITAMRMLEAKKEKK